MIKYLMFMLYQNLESMQTLCQNVLISGHNRRTML